jgi:hypothetical protein
MDFLLSRDQIGASGGFYNSDNAQDSSQFGACLTVTTIPVGTPFISAENDIIDQTFGIDDRRRIAALGTFVPFVYYYRPSQPWSAIYNISILQNVTGVAAITSSVSIWKSILSIPQDWLASLSPNPMVPLLRESFDVARRYLIALTRDDWLPLLTQLANNPSLPPTDNESTAFLSLFDDLQSHLGDPSSFLFSAPIRSSYSASILPLTFPYPHRKLFYKLQWKQNFVPETIPRATGAEEFRDVTFLAHPRAHGAHSTRKYVPLDIKIWK